MPFGMIGWTGLWMSQVVGFGDRSTGRGNLGGANMGRPTVTNGGLLLLENHISRHSDVAAWQAQQRSALAT